jgi:hypothetical protein
MKVEEIKTKLLGRRFIKEVYHSSEMDHYKEMMKRK